MCNNRLSNGALAIVNLPRWLMAFGAAIQTRLYLYILDVGHELVCWLSILFGVRDMP